MKLQGLQALVAGATGEVGRGAAFALSAQGATVYLAGRNAAKLEEIQTTMPNKSHILVADYSTVEGTKELKSLVQSLYFDVVVASSGPWWPVTKIANADPAVLQNAVAANILAQMNLYSVLAPRSKKYILVNGTAAKNVEQAGLTGITAFSVVGVAKLLNHESKLAGTPKFTHALVEASVGHAQYRGPTTNDPNEFGKAFVAMALDKHEVDGTGTITVDEGVYKVLVSKI